MNVLIAGAGRLGARIARVLAASDGDVAPVDTDEARLDVPCG
ncbi:hypothetical protein [Streptomyces prasinopilosus]|uniref:Trk system potassium uptake protein TrkA n=1 Tax=Streptomyces prasinopilosus TaxID=67344 RepID=A0A1G6TQD0_9ACTN|nr:hypothetical protein [Streptomyces prasinopilosus]SDD31313.1 hypothetical protein SAMN05216505_106294 [Streptomyces prasinopilosus]